MKLYTSNSTFDFGKFKNQKIKLILVENNEYLNWCFQKIDTFCVTEELFNKINFVIELKKGINEEFAEALKKMEELHTAKKKKYKNFQNSINDNKMFFFPFNSRIPFGKYNRMYINDILIKDNIYIKWCLEKVDTFATSIDVFDSLDYVIELRKNQDIDESKIELKRLEDLFAKKLIKYNQQNLENCYYSEYKRRLKNPHFQYGKYYKSENSEEKSKTKTFKDIPGFIGYYQASKCGLIKSLEIKLNIGNERMHIKKEKILRPDLYSNREFYVKLYNGSTWDSHHIKNLIAKTYLDFTHDNGKRVIHLDSNSLNNKLENLKVVSNNLDYVKENYIGGSPYKGVRWDKKNQCWTLYISIDGKGYLIAYFEDELQAAKTYKIEFKKYNDQKEEWIINYNKQFE